MNKRVSSLLIYAAKCVTATLIVYTVSSYFNYRNMPWSLISVLLILSPDGKDAVKLAFARIKANVIGAGVGLLCLLLSAPSMWTISLGFVIALSLCYLLRFEDSIRSALAATAIIMLHEEDEHLWDTALERVIAVMAGCMLGLFITFAFHFDFTHGDKKRDSDVKQVQ